MAAILRGEKTSTSSLLSDYDLEGGERLPAVGERFALLDADDRPVGVIETTRVEVTTIGQVDLAFAHAEGEGFASVAEWRAAHERFWRSTSAPGWEASDATPIVCEWFRLVEPARPYAR